MPVVVNNVSGTFVLDTGASFVVMTTSFAKKANVDIEQSTGVHLHTANGVVDGKRGRADMIQLRSLKARGVPVVIEADDAAAYGADGLLGLSFLSRFHMTIDGRSVRISADKSE